MLPPPGGNRLRRSYEDKARHCTEYRVYRELLRCNGVIRIDKYDNMEMAIKRDRNSYIIE